MSTMMKLLMWMVIALPCVQMSLYSNIIGRLKALQIHYEPQENSNYYDDYHYNPYDQHHHHQRQYLPPTTARTTPGPVFNFDQSSSFDLSNGGYLLTLLLLGALGAATFGVLAFSTVATSRSFVTDPLWSNILTFLETMEALQ